MSTKLLKNDNMDRDTIIGIENLRIISERYLNKEIEFNEFYSSLGGLLGSEFDPLEESLKDLSENLQKEIILYSRFSGGEFGEYEDFIPKRANWVYGEQTEDYGWIDKMAYYNLFKKAYQIIEVDDLPTQGNM